MRESLVTGVVNVWLVCVLLTTYYTVKSFSRVGLCSKRLLVNFNSTVKEHVYPHRFSIFNRLFVGLTHINHRTNKNKYYLYKFIIINHVEEL
jgi:hypothetical protein